MGVEMQGLLVCSMTAWMQKVVMSPLQLCAGLIIHFSLLEMTAQICADKSPYSNSANVTVEIVYEKAR